MSTFEKSQIYLELEHEIKRLSQSTMVTYRDATRGDAQQVISELESDIDNWIVQLRNRTIACYELENLLATKKSNITLPRLRNKGVNVKDIEKTKDDLLRLIAKSIMNSYLDTLFRNQNAPKHQRDDLYER